jgi:hypothetical protein
MFQKVDRPSEIVCSCGWGIIRRADQRKIGKLHVPTVAEKQSNAPSNFGAFYFTTNKIFDR